VREYYRCRYDLVRPDSFSRHRNADRERPSDPLPALSAVGGLGIRPTSGLAWISLGSEQMNDGFRSNHWLRSERAKVRNRRVSLVPVRPVEGPLTEPRADTQLARRELVFMPHCRH
jgi:hypothetical protein